MNIAIGSFAPYLEQTPALQVTCADPLLAQHAGTPWFDAAVAQEVGQPLQRDRDQWIEPTIPSWVSARPIGVFGKSGFGKTRFSEHLVLELLGMSSVVVIDGKGETVSDLRAHVRARQIDPANVTIIDTARLETLPGCNPFLTGLPPEHVAADMVDGVSGLISGPAPRMRDILENAAIILAYHRRSMYDLVAFLQRDDYRTAILRLPPPPGAGAAYYQSVSFFIHEFGGWGRAERASAVAPVLNKIRTFASVDALILLLSAKKNTLDLASLFYRPQLLLVSINRAQIGDTAARLATSIIISLLYRTALRLQGQGPVACRVLIDELPVIERLGGSLIDLFTTGRALQLPLIVSLQYLSGISDPLRAALLGNCAALITFALAYDDARLIAASLAAGREGQVERVSVRSKPGRDGEAETRCWHHPVLDGNGRRLRVNASGLQEIGRRSGGKAQIAALYELARKQDLGRLYIRAADTGQPVELRRYVSFVVPEDVWLSGPRLSLSVSFPAPYISATARASSSDLVHRFIRTIQELPVQHCVARIGDLEPRVVRVADLGIPTVPEEESLPAEDAGAQIKALIGWREAEIAKLCHGSIPEGEPDGSIA